MAGPSRAEQIPTALRGNSIILRWSEMRTWKRLEGRRAGQLFEKEFSASVTLYVSSQGRIFSKMERSSGQPVSNEISGSTDNVLQHWDFERDALVGYITAFERGVRRLQVDFSGRFDACSMSYVYGKLGGKEPVISDKGNLELVDFKVIAQACSVQKGNVFGGAQ